MKFNQAMNNFTSGEWSPKMYGRTDTDQYFRACREITNFIPVMQGGAFKRPGTRLMAAPTVTYNSVLIDTQARLDAADDVRAFTFVLSDGSENHLFMSNQAPSGGTSAWFVTTDLTNEGASRLRQVETYLSSNFAMNLDTAEIRQVGDIIFILDGEGVGPPRYLKKRSDGTHRFDLYNYHDFYNPPIPSLSAIWHAFPFTDLATNGALGTITVTGTFTVGGTVTLTGAGNFNSSMLAANNYGFGTSFRFTTGGTTGLVEITAVTNSTTATGAVRVALGGTSPVSFGTTTGTAWDRAAWGGGFGWPRSFTGYQGRLYFGGTASQPDTVWGTRIDNIFYMMEVPFAQSPDFATFADDNSRPWTFVPNSDSVANIQAMSSSKMLAILTDSCEITMYGSNGALGPNDVMMESSTFFGAENVQPTRVGNYLTYVQKGGKLRDLIYSFDEYQYKSNDLSFTSDHLGMPKRMVSAELGSSILFVLTEDREVRTLTLERDYQINAWAKHEFGGPGTVEVLDMAVLGKDQVYFVIRRTIDEDVRTSYELLSPFYQGPDDMLAEENQLYYGAYTYMDSTVSVPRGALALPASTSVTFGAIFADQEVDVFGLEYGDYKGHVYLGKFTCDASGIATDASFINYDVLTCGYAYQARLVPMAVEQGAQYGSPVGKLRRAEDIFFRFYKSLGCTYGNERETFDISMVDDTVPLDQAPPLKTGTDYMKFPQGINRDYIVVIESNLPHPLNILSVSFGGLGYD